MEGTVVDTKIQVSEYAKQMESLNGLNDQKLDYAQRFLG